ncbi:MAG: hypothetical protein ABII23_02870, partial [bacterium]
MKKIKLILLLVLGWLPIASAAITITVDVSRTSGVAPLAVFFDAVATTSDEVDRPFHDLDFTWDFGDPESGNWSTNGRSKNRAKGALSAHVFEPVFAEGETEKEFTVVLTVKDMQGNSDIKQAVITVQNPEVVYAGSNTRCVSASGNFEGAPVGCEQVTSSNFKEQMEWLFETETNRRVLFCRGETFSASDYFDSSNSSGQNTIGSYGSGDNPLVKATHSQANVTLYLRMDEHRGDARVMDIDFEGMNYTQTKAVCPTFNTLILRSRISQYETGLIDPPRYNKNIFIVDSEFIDNVFYGIFYSDARHVAILGSYFDYSEAHLLRTYISNSIIEHTIFKRAGNHSDQIKFCGVRPDQNFLNSKVEFGIISNNQFLDSGNCKYMVSIGPENNDVNCGAGQITDNIIVERNLWRISSPSNAAIHSRGADDITVRNNIFIRINLPILLDSQSIEGIDTWQNWKIYNNTAYQSSGSFIFFYGGFDIHGTEIKNNLIYALCDEELFIPKIIRYKEAFDQFESNNNMFYVPNVTAEFGAKVGAEIQNYMLEDWQTATSRDMDSKRLNETESNGLFNSINPDEQGFLILTDNSIAAGAGSELCIYDDFTGNYRTPADGIDIGAFEYGSTWEWQEYGNEDEPEDPSEPADPDNPSDPADPDNPADPDTGQQADGSIPQETKVEVFNNILKPGVNQAIIRCDMKEAGRLTVKIYDTQGKEIITLTDE